jgi:predicted RNA-binding Zn-ribbon protein involved in translation (DUF1610 family)
MTGVAAQMCGNKAEVESLGYRVENDGTILQQETDENGKQAWQPFSRLGARRAVLNDLSPAATFIAYNYNTPVDVKAFEREARRILAEVEAECGWMYETQHTDGKTKGNINYTLWSEMFSCPDCAEEIVFLKEAFDIKTKQVKDRFPCPHCGSYLDKKSLKRREEMLYDKMLKKTIKTTKKEPCLINYKVNDQKYEKVPDKYDLEILEKIRELEINVFFPSDRMMHKPEEIEVWGDKYRAGTASFSHVHHLYVSRAKYILALIWSKIETISDNRNKAFVRFCFEQSISGLSLLNRYQPVQFGRVGGSQVNRQMNGVYYIASQHSECSPWYIFDGKIKRLIHAFTDIAQKDNTVIHTGDSSKLPLREDSFDYIFVDPPFGDNIAYAELNFVLESFYKIFTNVETEAIISKTQKKKIETYYWLMKNCFSEFYRILKPGHWMTVEFSNTKTSIWNIIQTALSESGFIVASVSALDKKQGSYNSVTNPTSVKQDLVISAYKPNGGFEQRFIKEADTPEGVWDFVRTHLNYLPVVKVSGDTFQHIPERDPRILFDQVVAYYVRKNVSIPIASSQEFQAGLPQRFDERDGMYFLAEQVSEYDGKKLSMGNRIKSAELFVLDEATAIQWLRQTLQDKPQTFQQLHPHFMQEISGWNKNEKQLELSVLLEQNFLKYNKDHWHVPDPENAAHIEQMREKALLKEFETYKTAAKRLKIFRIEAVRAGFKKAYIDHDYETIVKTADKLHGNVIEEDPTLLMYYSNAQTRLDRD